MIAVNYPARESGIGRHCDVTEAKKLCPGLIAQHVATWREGDDKWAYRDDSAQNIATDKVSLDPYRLESRKILALVKEALPAHLQKVEKASIDEVFLDLSAQVHSILLDRFPGLSSPPPYDDPTETLPLPSVVALDWKADALVDLDQDQESQDPDWDDVAILIGSEIVRDVRARVHEQLGYTCSAGIASNKLVSKLGSGFKKPNKQTVVRSRAVSAFLEGFKVTKMRNLGGKLGEQVVSAFNTDSIKELVALPLDQMKSKLGDETGQWVYNSIRGIDFSEVNSRTQIKSMLSAKSFRPTIDSSEQAIRWLRVFVADIYSRLVEEGVLENKRRPRSINLHHRHAGQMRSRQGPIPTGRAIDELLLFDLAKDLLGQIVTEGKVWPCANLSLSVGGFEDGIKGNMGIDAFLVKGEEAESLRCTAPESRPASTGPERPAKKRRVEDGGIHRFFAKTSSTETGLAGDNNASAGEAETPDKTPSTPGCGPPVELSSMDQGDFYAALTCPRCSAGFHDPEELQGHQDWHMAKDLQEEERRGRHTFDDQASVSRPPGQKKTATAKRGRGGKLEQGQSRLKFG